MQRGPLVGHERSVRGLLDQHVLEAELGFGPTPALADQVESLQLEQRPLHIAPAA